MVLAFRTTNRCCRISCWWFLIAVSQCEAFFVAQRSMPHAPCIEESCPQPQQHESSLIRRMVHRDDAEEDEEEKVNPYADPNYPDLEFIDYSNPEYSADQSEEYHEANKIDDEVALEEMREERRRRNDEYQFRTYHRDFCHTYKGEWTTYSTNLLDDPTSAMPVLTENDTKQTVVSSAVKDVRDDVVTEFDIDRECIRHFQEYQSPTLMGDAGIAAFEASFDGVPQPNHNESQLLSYWPDLLLAKDFRGEQGIMVCGRAYTICTAIPMDPNQEANVGPFSEYRAEVGIATDDMRFRIKLDYGTSDGLPFALLLKTLTVCRETREEWPRAPDTAAHVTECLFGSPGAMGGLYDPPPLKSEEQAKQYIVVDLEGGATALIPFRMDQHESAEHGYVVSLDWTAGPMRYQVDRKVDCGKNLLRLRTLELSEVRREDADTYRPRDGGQDMRQ